MAEQIGLEAAKSDLQIEIRNSFQKIYNLSLGANANGKKADPLLFLEILSQDLTNAIHKYATRAKVDIEDINITVNKQIPVTVTNGTFGSTTGVGTTTKTGKGLLK